MTFRPLLITFFLFSFTSGNAQELDSVLQKYYNQKEFAGVIAGISIDGKITHLGQAGFAYLEDSTQFSLDMHTRIASIVKPMTAIAIMQLVEQKKIHLDDPVAKHIPEFSKGNKSKITVRQLLSHTAGVPGYKNDKEQEDLKHFKNLEKAFSAIKKRELSFDPGSQYSYTSYGYLVLGILIERISGKSYENYMMENIWSPLWMVQTHSENLKTQYSFKARLYSKNENGTIVRASKNDLSDRVPGGGVHSTLRDLLKFGDGINNHQLIGDSTLQIMLQDPQIKQGGNGYGLGFTLYGNNPLVGPIFGHSGSQTGCSALLFILPEKKATICILSNTSGANAAIGKTGMELLQSVN